MKKTTLVGTIIIFCILPIVYFASFQNYSCKQFHLIEGSLGYVAILILELLFVTNFAYLLHRIISLLRLKNNSELQLSYKQKIKTALVCFSMTLFVLFIYIIWNRYLNNGGLWISCPIYMLVDYI